MGEPTKQTEVAYHAALYALMAAPPVLGAGEIAATAGYDRARAGRALEYLVGCRLVIQGDPTAMGFVGGKGRPPKTTYALSNGWGYAIGVAAGHRGVGTALIDARGAFQELGTSSPPSLVDDAISVADDYHETLRVIARQIVNCVRRRQDQLREVDDDAVVDVRAITVGLPGQIDGIHAEQPTDRRVSTVLSTFKDQPFARDLAYELERVKRSLSFNPRAIPIYIENDADCLAMGELHHGEGRGARSILVLKVSAGIGAGIVSDGELHYGCTATTGEIGHDPVHPAVLEALNETCPDGLAPLDPASASFVCSCAAPNEATHLEAFASATAVVCRLLDCAKADLPLEAWRTAMEDLRQRITDGDEKALKVVTDAGALIGQKVNTLAAVLGPEVVLISGSLADDVLLSAIHDGMEPLKIPLTHAPSDVRLGARDPESRWIGPKGAARMALEQGVWGPHRRIGEGLALDWHGHQTAEALTLAQRGKRARRHQ